MNYKIMFLTLSIVGLLLSLNACSIEGEEICGIWNANGDYGQMKIEITPWDGQFHGHLLEYKNGKEMHKGAKTEEHIFLTDLVYEANMYKNGKIYLAPSSEETCGLSLKMLDKNQVQASYTCQGQAYQETWTREGHPNTKKVVAEKKC